MALTIAQKFSIGVSSWTWCVGPMISPPPRRWSQARQHLGAHVLRRAEGQRVLFVDAAPEAQLVAVNALELGGSMQAGWTGLSTSRPISIRSGMIGGCPRPSGRRS